MENTTGKIPPQDVELENCVLGCILTENTAFEKIADILKQEMFYNAANQNIFRAAQTLYNSQQPIDIHTVRQALTKRGQLENAGGLFHLAEITGVSSGGHIERHAYILKQKWMSREVIKLTADAQSKAFSEQTDIADTISEIEKKITELTESEDEEDEDFVEVLTETKKYMKDMERIRLEGGMVALPTPLRIENEKLSGGFRSPELIILGARPAMGKTQIAIEHTEKFMEYGAGAFFSLEMKKTQILLRMVAKAGISTDNIKQGTMSREEWEIANKRFGELSAYDLAIFDKVRTINGIIRKCRKLKRQNRLKFVVIDYLQLIRTDEKFNTRDIEVGHITNRLKSMAVELDIPIMLLCQLNRSVEGRADKRPLLSDLRESGNIEQDADIVMFIHRPSYYNTDAFDNENTPWKERGELIIAKNREGTLGTIIFEHDSQFKRIWDYDEEAYKLRTFRLEPPQMTQKRAWEIDHPF